MIGVLGANQAEDKSSFVGRCSFLVAGDKTDIREEFFLLDI
jgi:hypothetical protein